MAHTPIIHVTFIEGATGQMFGQSDLPLDQLPATFDTSTTLHIGNQDWHVDKAEPTRAEEFSRTGALRLTLSRVSYMDPKKILFTLPTLEDAIPSADGQVTALGPRHIELHEDDWRQVEFVSAEYVGKIEAELADIETIYREHSVDNGAFLGFREIHVRTRIPAPINPMLPVKDVWDALGVTETSFDTISFRGIPGAVPASFAVQVEDLIVYGAGDANSFYCLGIHGHHSFLPEPIRSSLQQLMIAHNLYLVDWPRMAVAAPNDTTSLVRYFSGK